MSDPNHVLIARQSGVLKIGINRPEKKNALNQAMYESIGQAFITAGKDPDIRVVLLHGLPDCFSAGNDLADFNHRDPNKPSPGSLLLQIMHDFEKPVLAAVSGLAVGIGTTMLLHCDLVYAESKTRFRLPFVDLGVCPEAGSSLTLPAIVGHRRAAELLMLGEFFSIETAIDAGIVTRGINGEALMEVANAKAVALTEKPVEALLATKRLLKQTQHQSVKERMDEEFRLFRKLLQTPESIAARQRAMQGSKKSM